MDQNQVPQPEPEFQIDFKPNLYPIMYWAIAYGAVAGIALFLLNFLSSFINVLWAPVFLVGLVWGGYRQYQRQKAAWRMGQGVPATKNSPVEEFKQAVGDVVTASRELMTQNVEEEAQQALQQQEAAEQELVQQEELQQTAEEELPPQNQPPQANL